MFPEDRHTCSQHQVSGTRGGPAGARGTGTTPPLGLRDTAHRSHHQPRERRPPRPRLQGSRPCCPPGARPEGGGHPRTTEAASPKLRDRRANGWGKAAPLPSLLPPWGPRTWLSPLSEIHLPLSGHAAPQTLCSRHRGRCQPWPLLWDAFLSAPQAGQASVTFGMFTTLRALRRQSNLL